MPTILDHRHRQMRRALKWSASLFAGYLFITYQVLSDGFLVRIDRELNNFEHPRFRGTIGFIVRRLDDLGLRSVSGISLLIVALYISKRFRISKRYERQSRSVPPMNSWSALDHGIDPSQVKDEAEKP